jgi:hypothetical protein
MREAHSDLLEGDAMISHARCHVLATSRAVHSTYVLFVAHELASIIWLNPWTPRQIRSGQLINRVGHGLIGPILKSQGHEIKLACTLSVY